MNDERSNAAAEVIPCEVRFRIVVIEFELTAFSQKSHSGAVLNKLRHANATNHFKSSEEVLMCLFLSIVIPNMLHSNQSQNFGWLNLSDSKTVLQVDARTSRLPKIFPGAPDIIQDLQLYLLIGR